MLDHRLDLGWEEEDRRRRRGAPPNRQQRARRKKKRRQKGKSYGALIISLVLLLVVGGGVYWGIGQIQQNQGIQEFLAADYEQGDMGEEVTFRVEAGDGGTTIAVRLLAAGVVKSRTAFVQVCEARTVECKSIQPGSYTVQKGSPAEVVFSILIDPANALTSQFTIVEGLSVVKTLKSLAEQTGLPLADFQAAVTDPAALGIAAQWYARLDAKPAALTSVEGFLFPDTYFYDPTATAKDIVQLMVDHFFTVAGELGLQGQAAAKGIGVYELLIAASIAQVEVKAQDFAKAARVIYNRAYNAEMPLGMDTAVNYWLELNGLPEKNSGDMTSAELHDRSNPYNTHDNVGMPFGPISNPGRAALQAAANPADGDWLYFVATDSSTTVFTSSYSAHCAAIAAAIANGANLMYC